MAWSDVISHVRLFFYIFADQPRNPWQVLVEPLRIPGWKSLDYDVICNDSIQHSALSGPAIMHHHAVKQNRVLTKK